jgi:predicted component of type VI protein secretion system
MIRRNDFIFARHPDPLSINSSVSRLHAKIIYEGGNFVLYDTGSANGTSIIRNGQTIDLPRAEISGQQLQNNDVIVLGSAQISFNLISREEAITLVSFSTGKLPIHNVASEDSSEGADDTFSISRKDLKKELDKLQ